MAENVLILTLPWGPSVNHYKRIGRLIKTRTGKTYQQRVNSPATIAYFYQVFMRAKATMHPEWLKIAGNETTTFQLDVNLYPPDKRIRDIDGPLKVLIDSLVHAHVINDDSQITRLVVQKMDKIGQGQVIVRIQELSNAHQRS